jgi:hypothetical protein
VMRKALLQHWPEYLIEAAALGLFMISACTFGTILDHPASLAHLALPNPLLRRALMGLAMGPTAVGIIFSPWGKRVGSGRACGGGGAVRGEAFPQGRVADHGRGITYTMLSGLPSRREVVQHGAFASPDDLFVEVLHEQFSPGLQPVKLGGDQILFQLLLQ